MGVCGMTDAIKIRSKSRYVFARVIIYIVLGIAAITTIFPYVWMVLASFKTGLEITTYPEQIFPRIFLNEDLGHGLFELRLAGSAHTAGKIKTVNIQRRLFKAGLIYIQGLHQNIGGGHLDR